MAWEKREEDLEEILQKQAQQLWGDERAKELGLSLQQIAHSISAIYRYEIPWEEEPVFFFSNPFSSPMRQRPT